MQRRERLDRWSLASRPLVTPSLLACDFSSMADELAAVRDAGAVAVHLDVMDGHFVPNLSYGPPVIASWRARTDLTFDAHLMMSDPGRYLDDFVEAGCDRIAIHVEAVPEPIELLGRIRAAGCQAVVALNPPTPVAAILPLLDALDGILVMSVMPGFGGQSFEPDVLPKVRAIRERRPGLEIAIDGGINASTATAACEAGVTQLVAGSSVFRRRPDFAAALGELAEAGRRGRSRGGVTAPTAGDPSQA